MSTKNAFSFERDSRNTYVNFKDPLKYMPGFGNYHVSEALPHALPESQNAPQKCNYGLYAEQLQGTSFTAPRTENQKSWLYRILPSVIHTDYEEYKDTTAKLVSSFEKNASPNQYRFMPPKDCPKDKSVDFVNGLFHVAGAGCPQMKEGFGILQYTCNSSMKDSALCNSDGDMLIVPERGILVIQTEMGTMQVQPTEIAVIPRGIKFSVQLKDPHQEGQHQQNNEEKLTWRGYIAEIYHSHFVIPDLGPIGANGLANPRDFDVPVATYEDRSCSFALVHKYQGKLFKATLDHSVFDVVAWHGNYYPYKYDLKKFNAMGTVTYDHPDPSIFTVLTCQTPVKGTAVLDFVIFPPRWAVAEHTFRPPYYHRNTMSEYMGLIYGSYEAKEKGFVPGGASLHNCMSAHGPEAEVFEKASTKELKPERAADGSLAFMFESSFMINPTDYYMQNVERDTEYMKCWSGLKKHFKP